MAPTSVEDCFAVIVEAFNAAERFQVPVIMLSDQSLVPPPRDRPTARTSPRSR